METTITLMSDAFRPTAGELDPKHDDYINDGMFALELGEFLAGLLESNGYKVKFSCQEDWGRWIEIEHAGNFALAVGCSNMEHSEIDDTHVMEHRVIVTPDEPVIRKWFKKIDVRGDVEPLVATLFSAIEQSDAIEKAWLGES